MHTGIPTYIHTNIPVWRKTMKVNESKIELERKNLNKLQKKTIYIRPALVNWTI